MPTCYWLLSPFTLEQFISADHLRVLRIPLAGGGKGAAIGAAIGGAGGAGAQVYTGRKKEIPAETELKFKLAQDLELRPASKIR